MSDPIVGVVMGSQSDWDVMQHTANVLRDFGVAFEHKVVSAHRTPDAMFEYAEAARDRGKYKINDQGKGRHHECWDRSRQRMLRFRKISGG